MAAVLTVTAFGVVLTPPPATAADPVPTSDAAQAAAGWLARQLVDGDHFNFSGTTFGDVGLTIDSVLAFDAAGVAQDAAVRATAWFSTPAMTSGYVGDGTTESYAGAVAKMMLVAEAQGLDPTSFGGMDLVARLGARLQASGRYTDLSPYGEFSNTIRQSLAVIALGRRSGGAPTAAVDFLVSSQCSDGGFPQDFGQANCTSSIDSTAFAVQAVRLAGRTASGDRALDYLNTVQLSGGGFGDGTGNANSTGLAVQALRSGGRGVDVVAALRGYAFLRTLQVGCAGPVDKQGSVPFDATGAGDTPRATAQAVLGLVRAGEGLATIGSQGDSAASPALDCRLPSSSATERTLPTNPTTTSTTSTTRPGGAGVAGTPTTSTTVTTNPGQTAVLSGASVSSTPTTLGSRELVRTGDQSASWSAIGLVALVAGGWLLWWIPRRPPDVGA